MWPRSALGMLVPPVPPNRPRHQQGGNGPHALATCPARAAVTVTGHSLGLFHGRVAIVKLKRGGERKKVSLFCHKQGSGWSLPLRLRRGLHMGLYSWRWILPRGTLHGLCLQAKPRLWPQARTCCLSGSGFRVSLSAPRREHLILETA